jgi:hypothetical protein
VRRGPSTTGRVEVAAWIAGASGALKLVGTEDDPDEGKRDVSRLLASGSLIVQRAVGGRDRA